MIIQVTVERNATSRTVVLNRPSFLNALNTPMVWLLYLSLLYNELVKFGSKNKQSNCYLAMRKNNLKLLEILRANTKLNYRRDNI